MSWDPSQAVSSIPFTIFSVLRAAPTRTCTPRPGRAAFILIAFVLVTSLTSRLLPRPLAAQARPGRVAESEPPFTTSSPDRHTLSAPRARSAGTLERTTESLDTVIPGQGEVFHEEEGTRPSRARGRCGLALGCGRVGAKQRRRVDQRAPAAASSTRSSSSWTPALGTAFGYTLSYASVGSGTGIADITARTVDFGASDAPLNPTQPRLQRLRRDPVGALGDRALVQRPGRHRTRPPPRRRRRSPGSTSGQITNWNDPAIEALNPKADAPEPRDHAGPPHGRLG